MIDRYAKQRIFLGSQADGRLRSRRVAVVGLGATGSVIASWLARAGVGHLTLIDREGEYAHNDPNAADPNGEIEGNIFYKELIPFLEGVG